MRKLGLAWGAVVAVLAYGVTAQAAPKAAGATGGTAGAAGAGSTAPSGPAPGMPAPSAAAPVPPDTSTAPAPDAVTPPAPPAEAEPSAEEEAKEEAKEREAARKRVRRRRAQLEAEAEADADADEAQEQRRTEVEQPRPRAHDWRLVGQHFMVSAERITNILGWSTVESVPIFDGFNGPTTSTVEVERAGTDVSFLGSGGVSKNLFAVPRLAVDGMFANGLTLGGSISYMVASGERQRPTSNNSKITVEDPTVTMFVFAPRLGIMIPASRFLGVWVRGGISRLSASSEARQIDSETGEQQTTTVTSTVTLVNLTLDPQLVFVPVPHVGITLGALLDIGVSGGIESSDGGQEQDFKASSYGVSGGLVAIF